MSITGEGLTFVLGLMAIAGGLWKIFNAITGMKNELRLEIRDVKDSLEKKDILLESIHDKTAIGVVQLKERIEHSSNRLKAELKELTMRVNGLEGFLIKTTDYKERDYGSSQGTR